MYRKFIVRWENCKCYRKAIGNGSAMNAVFTDIHRQGLKRLLHFCERLLERPETPEEQLNCLPDAEFERLLKGLETEVLDNICRLSGSPNE